MSRSQFRLISIFCTGLLVLAVGQRATAFMASEDAQFRADLREAIARARDFAQTLEERERAVRELEHQGYTETAARAEYEKRREDIRLNYIRLRNARPSQEAMRERLEREDDLQKENELRQMDQYRREYIRKRNEVRAVIEHDAHIDEKREYGL